MCGIAGIVSLSPERRVQPESLRLMAGELAHRGPDDEGYYLDPQGLCGFGFRRLSIIDLETGNQPIANETDDVFVVFNGEIYNFRDLRAELEAAGHRFRTKGDAEVIVHAYEQWGEQLCQRLNGMFALAVWDRKRGELLLARDRFGKKPLVYAVHDGRLYFASEAKAILALPEIPRELDPQSLHRYLIFQYVPAPHSIYRGFAKVPPGHFMRVSAQRAPGTPERYYSPPTDGSAPADAGSTMDDLDAVLARAVQRRLISDVPLGAFLSGGTDSSIVVALMRRLGVSPLRTFSIGFEDARYDESAYARRVAQHFQTEHHEHVVTPQAREILDTLAYHYDEPFADSSAIPTYYVAKFTRQSVKVALTGDGGDECFGGYDRYWAARMAARLDWMPRFLRRAISAASRVLPRGRARSPSHRAYRFFSALGRDAAVRYLDWVNVFSPHALAAGYAPPFAEQIDLDGPVRSFGMLYGSHQVEDAARRAMRVDFHTYLPYDLLTKVDVASMACSLECRCPFLDPDLVAFASRLDPKQRMGKRLLRRWAAQFVPPGIVDRPKMGFGVPVGEWFRADLRDLLEQRVLRPDGICARVFRRPWLQRLVDEHVEVRANHEHRLWSLLMLELWHERWLGAPVI